MTSFETVMMLEFGIQGSLNLCSRAVVPHFWLQNELSLIPFEVRVVFLVNTPQKFKASLSSMRPCINQTKNRKIDEGAGEGET